MFIWDNTPTHKQLLYTLFFLPFVAWELPILVIFNRAKHY